MYIYICIKARMDARNLKSKEWKLNRSRNRVEMAHSAGAERKRRGEAAQFISYEEA
jgi:hypothetical protein